MKEIYRKLLEEPAAVFGSLTAVAAAAAGVWNEPALAFLASALAGVGAVFTRRHVTPIVKD